MALTVLLGGARSGKSALAVEWGRAHGATGAGVTFVATAPPVDTDMEERISRHRAERPPAWTTIEEPLDLRTAIGAAGADDLVIVDCLTLWVSNLMLDGHDDEAIGRLAGEAARAATARRAPTTAISNEVGSGVHPETELGRRYRDALGRVNQIWVAAADHAYLVVAGRVVPLARPPASAPGAVSAR